MLHLDEKHDQSSKLVVKIWAMFCLFFMVSVNVETAKGEEVWEYRSYQSRFWIHFDSQMSVSPSAKARIIECLEDQLEIAFAAGVDAVVEEYPDELARIVRAKSTKLEISDLLSQDYVLVLAKGEDQNNSIRSLATALEKLDAIQIANVRLPGIQKSLQQHPDFPGASDLQRLLKGTDEDLSSAIKAGSVRAAILSRSELEGVASFVRQLPIRFPWQVESLLRQNDKLFLIDVEDRGDRIRVIARELDCNLRFVGEVFENDAFDLELLPRVMVHSIVQAFSPIVRIEETTATSAIVRIRGAKLVKPEGSPIVPRIGDVFMPMVLRSERSGGDTNLQIVPWTYIALVEGDDVRMRGAVFTGVQGGLTGRQNARIQRLGIQVKVAHPGTSVEFASQDLSNPNAAVEAVPGVALYQRVPGAQPMDLIGRSDWRGRLRLPSVTSPEIEVEAVRPKPEIPAEAGNEPASSPSPSPPAAPAESTAKDVASEGDGKKSSEATAPNADDEDATKSAPATAIAPPPVPEPPETPKLRVQLNVPLYLYYIKNGERILAKLPIVVGRLPLERADVPDDSRRLEAESFLRGIESEIMDTVAKRKILEIRIKDRLAKQKPDDAKKFLEELRKLKNYQDMSESLQNVQRRLQAGDRGPIAPMTQKRIDQLFVNSRQMMQKYLQDSQVRDLEVKVAEALGETFDQSAVQDTPDPEESK